MNFLKTIAVNFIFKRTWFLYIYVGGIFYFSIFPSRAYLNRLNALLPIEEGLHEFALGKTDLGRDQFRWGIRYYQEVLKKNYSSAQFYHNMGFCYYYLQDYRQAQTVWEKALTMNPRLYFSAYDLGLMAFKAKDYSKATTYFSQVITRLPQTFQYYAHLGSMLKKSGKDKALTAVMVLNQQVYQDSQNVYALMAKSYFYQKKNSEMQEALRRAIKEHPENAMLRNLWEAAPAAATIEGVEKIQKFFESVDVERMHFYWELRMLEQKLRFNS